MKAVVWCMVLIKNMVCFELETSWPRTYDWSADKHLKNNNMWCALPFENIQTLVILASISKTSVVGTGVTPRGTAACLSRSSGFYIPFWMQSVFWLLVCFSCQEAVGYLSCPFPAPPSHEHLWGGCFFVLVSVPHVYLGSTAGTAQLLTLIMCLAESITLRTIFFKVLLPLRSFFG